MLTGYLGFTHYWILAHYTKAEARVLSSELRQWSELTSRPGSVPQVSHTFTVHCTVSYLVAGKTLQSELDSPPSSYRIDAQAWGGELSPGRTIDILYESSNPHRIRLANNPAEVTVVGSIKAAFYLLVPGLLLVFTSRPKSGRQ